MPRTYDVSYFLEDLCVPEELLPRIMETPRLLPGEKREDFFLVFEAMVTELIPDLDLEWLLTIDVAWIFFEIQRYRRWKNAIILINQRAALEEALVRSDPSYMLQEPSAAARGKIRLTVDHLEGDPSKNRDVAAQLKHYGYDEDALNAMAFMQGVPALATIERFLVSSRQQLSTILRDFAVRREFKLRVEQAKKRLLAEHRQLQASRQEAKPS